MSVQTEPQVVLPKVQLVETDGEPLESHWHFLQIILPLDLIAYRLRDRNDYYAGGNMFIYYSEEQARNRAYRGPDFFYVDGVSRSPLRPYWAVWQEGGRYPDRIIELLSPTTAREDRTTKKTLYERTFRTFGYFCYDPDKEQLEGWRLGPRQRYRTISANERGRMEVEELGVWLGTWREQYQGFEAVWLRFYDAEGRLVPIPAELAAARRPAPPRCGRGTGRAPGTPGAASAARCPTDRACRAAGAPGAAEPAGAGRRGMTPAAGLLLPEPGPRAASQGKDAGAAPVGRGTGDFLERFSVR
jgi:Uma2 family endonuclease